MPFLDKMKVQNSQGEVYLYLLMNQEVFGRMRKTCAKD